ncbi:DegT/DnrJ/EryC1/StrS family aminotransferase [bacterium]|nr:DegT/DnrJ/EryC1/StrS family aminotransferase [bacterium]
MKEEMMRRVERYDLVSPMMPCKDEILAGVDRILSTGSYILGEEVHALEREMAEACGGADSVGVASGSAALYLALQLAGVGPGTEVITTPYTFVATVEAVIRLGGTPVYVDIGPDDLNLQPDQVAEAVTDRTRVILPVHIFGVPCDMDALLATAAQHDLDLVEDMCQAFGSLYKGRPCGSFGRMSCLSFYPTKNLPGIGDGGLVICREADDAVLIRKLRGHEAVRIDGRLCSGWNSRIDEIQALAIRVRLARFGDEQADRDRAAAIYDEAIPAPNRFSGYQPNGGLRVTHHQYWIRVPERGRLAAELKAAGIDFGIYYAPPLHRHELTEYCRVHGELRHAEAAGEEILTLPIYPSLADDDARRIGDLVRKHLNDCGA